MQQLVEQSPCGLVKLDGGIRQFSAFKHTQNDAAGLDGSRFLALDGKFHVLPPDFAIVVIADCGACGYGSRLFRGVYCKQA
jgi:hypothetical protein